MTSTVYFQFFYLTYVVCVINVCRIFSNTVCTVIAPVVDVIQYYLMLVHSTGVKIQSTLTYRLDEVLKLRLLP